MAKASLNVFDRQKTVLLTTYRRDGTPVGTPVHIAVDGDRAFFRTWDTAWKAKRIRNKPSPCVTGTFGAQPLLSAERYNDVAANGRQAV